MIGATAHTCSNSLKDANKLFVMLSMNLGQVDMLEITLL